MGNLAVYLVVERYTCKSHHHEAYIKVFEAEEDARAFAYALNSSESMYTYEVQSARYRPRRTPQFPPP